MGSGFYLKAIAALALVTAAGGQQQGYFSVVAAGGGWTMRNPAGELVKLHAGTLYPPLPGFDALGPGADAAHWHKGVPFVFVLGISSHLENDRSGDFVDVYADGFEDQVGKLAEAAGRPLRQAHDLIGYMSDEQPGWAAAGGAEKLMREYLALPDNAGGRQRAIEYLRERYNSDIGKFNQAWGKKARDFDQIRISAAPTAAHAAAVAADAQPFFLEVLTRYVHVCAEAVHDADANHLFLGPGLELGEGDARVGALAEADVIVSSGAQPPAGRATLLELSSCDAAAQARALGFAQVVGFACR